MIRTAPPPQNIIIGTFLFLAAVVCAVAPIALVYRSLGILLFSLLAFAVGGMPFAYLTALLAPPLGLISGDAGWQVMFPIVISANLLSMLGLEYAWRLPALIVSPLLQVTPQLFALQASKRDLFAVELPWEPAAALWVLLHGLVALGGVLIAIILDRRRARPSSGQAQPS